MTDPQRFAGESVQEGAAHDAHQEQGSEQYHGVDRGAALPLPIDIAEVQPERKLIQCQRGTHAVQDRHYAAGPWRRGANIGSELQEPAVAYDQEQKDPEYQVMNMTPAHFDVVEWAPPGVDGMGENPNHRERDIKRRGRQQLALAMPFFEGTAINIPYPFLTAGVDGKRQHGGEERQSTEEGEGDSTRMEQQQGHIRRLARLGPV